MRQFQKASKLIPQSLAFFLIVLFAHDKVLYIHYMLRCEGGIQMPLSLKMYATMYVRLHPVQMSCGSIHVNLHILGSSVMDSIACARQIVASSIDKLLSYVSDRIRVEMGRSDPWTPARQRHLHVFTKVRFCFQFVSF